MLEISRLVMSLFTTSKETLVLRGSTLPSMTRPGVLSYRRLTSSPFSSRPSQRYLILVCRSIALACRACSIWAMSPNTRGRCSPASSRTSGREKTSSALRHRRNNGGAVGGVQDVVGRHHQHARLELRLQRQRHVHGHLVAVEVGGERGADERMQLDGLALHHYRLQ